MKRHREIITALLMGVGLIVAACTGGASPAPSAAAPTAAPTAAATAATAPAPAGLIASGQVTDCVDIEYSPMEFYPKDDPNNPTGFDIEAFQAVAKFWGLTANIRSTTFDGLIPDLTAGRCDVVWSALYISEKRLAVADAVPYMATGQVVMVPSGNPKGIKTETDLCGKTISIQSGGLVEQRITESSKKCTDAGQAAINIQGYPKVADEFQQIVVGRVDGVWETDTAVSDWLIANPGKYEVAFGFPKTDSYGVYFAKNKPELKAALAAALKALKDDGTLVKLAQKYQMDSVILDAIK